MIVNYIGKRDAAAGAVCDLVIEIAGMLLAKHANANAKTKVRPLH
jgi:hypothetical protein